MGKDSNNNKRIFIERFASPPRDSNDNLSRSPEIPRSFAPVFGGFDAMRPISFSCQEEAANPGPVWEEADGGKRLGLFEFSLHQSKHPENLLTSNTSLKRAGGQRRFFFFSSFFGRTFTIYLRKAMKRLFPVNFNPGTWSYRLLSQLGFFKRGRLIIFN